jgi:TusA-related sulfurtransferase
MHRKSIRLSGLAKDTCAAALSLIALWVVVPSADSAPSGSGGTFASDLEICYEVLLYLSSRLRQVAPGQTLEFVSGDPQAEEKVCAWIEQREYVLLDHSRLPDGRWRFLIQR